MTSKRTLHAAFINMQRVIIPRDLSINVRYVKYILNGKKFNLCCLFVFLLILNVLNKLNSFEFNAKCVSSVGNLSGGEMK